MSIVGLHVLLVKAQTDIVPDVCDSSVPSFSFQRRGEGEDMENSY